MTAPFTEHVRHFGADSFPGDDVLGTLRQLLRRRLRQRHLLHAPPAYLGYDAPSWTSERAEDAWQDLVTDCYLFAIVDRLQGLRNQLAVNDSIDGIVVHNVDLFLIERQRRQDRVGYTTFQNVVGAVRLAETAGWLSIAGQRKGRLYNDSLLLLDGAPPGARPLSIDMLRDRLAAMPGWNDIFPKMLRTGTEPQHWLFEFVNLLRRESVKVLRLGDLVDVVGRRVRDEQVSRHAAAPHELALEGDDAFVAVVKLVRPDDDLERREGWERLRGEVEAEVQALNRQRRVRERLLLVFREIARRVEEDDGRPIRQADVVKALDVAPSVINGDFQTLGEILKNRLRTRQSSSDAR